MDRDALLTVRVFLSACDRLVTGGVLFLILFTPLAFGAVHPWAFALMEAVLFFLVMVWAGKLLAAPAPIVAVVRGGRFLATPLALLIGFVLVQLTPLPPTLLAVLSPATYEVYSRALPGWPEQASSQANVVRSVKSQERGGQGWEQEEPPPYVVLPTPEEVKKGAPVPQFLEIAAAGERSVLQSHHVAPALLGAGANVE